MPLVEYMPGIEIGIKNGVVLLQVKQPNLSLILTAASMRVARQTILVSQALSNNLAIPLQLVTLCIIGS